MISKDQEPSYSTDQNMLRRQSVVIDQKLKSILNDRFFHETTMHGFSHLSNAGSIPGMAFWMIVTLFAFAVAGYQIVNDVEKLYSDEMTINFRQPKIKGRDDDENKLPAVDFCYNTWTRWFDFREAREVKNLTTDQISFLMSIFAGHSTRAGQCINDTRVRWSLNQKFGSIVHMDEIVKNLTLKDLRRRCQRKNTNCYFSPMPSKLCMQFSLSTNVQNAKEVIFFNKDELPPEWKGDQGNDVGLIGHLFINSKTFSAIRKEMDVVGHDMVIMPSAVNMPASYMVDCPKISEPTDHAAFFNEIPPVVAKKLFCKGAHVYHEDQNSNFTLKFQWREQILDVERKSGLKCYKWSYALSTHKKFQGKMTNRLFILATIEKSQSWIITEYKPVLTWEQLIANIGGTLGVWTGASILSFIHLVHFVLTKSVRK